MVAVLPITMNSSLVSSLPVTRASRPSLFRQLAVVTSVFVLTGSLLAQTDPNAQGGRKRGGGNAQDAGGNNNGGGRGNFDPAQAQQQMMDRMREQLEITDDGEWKVISERLTVVNDLRRAAGGGGRGGPPGGGGPGGPGGQQGGGRTRGGGGGSPEADALRQAIQDKLPDAEIKSRLTRVRETRKMNEEKLQRAQEELRAVLSVRQEAVAVMFGLLP